jgi:hypothetical protein
MYIPYQYTYLINVDETAVREEEVGGLDLHVLPLSFGFRHQHRLAHKNGHQSGDAARSAGIESRDRGTSAILTHTSDFSPPALTHCPTTRPKPLPLHVTPGR